MRTTKLLPTLTVGLAVALAMPACSGRGATAEEDLSKDRPVAETVTGRAKVPTIRLLTKTAAEDPRRYEQARLVVEAWRTAGIPAELLAVRGSEVTRRAFTSKDFDVYLVTYDPTPERLDPDNLLARFYSANAGDSGSNVSGYRNRRFDQLYTTQRTAATEAARRAAVQEAQRLLNEQQPVRPFAHLTVAGAYRADRWDGISKARGYPVFNIWNAIGATPKTDRRELVVGTISEPPTLNPVTLETSEAQLPLSLIYDSLVRIGPDGSIRDWAAQDVTVDGTKVTASLRPDMKFSDGKPVTAEDVAFTIRYLVAKKSPLFASKLADVKNIQVSGNSVVMTLAQPSSSFVGTVLSQMPILPSHVWEPIADPLTFANRSPVGSGPFVLTDRKQGAELRFTANPTHFSAPKVDGLVMTILGSFDAEIGALDRGDIDMLGDIQSAAQLDALKRNDDVDILTDESFGWSGLHYNMRREPFSDRHFRMALSLLVPSQDIIDTVLEGQGKPAGSVIAPTLEKWSDPSVKPPPYDVGAAMSELKAAGYVFDKSGTLYYPDRGSDQRVLDNDAGK